ncbi:MAG: aminotransferase class I/II-fold pyridoxal phosphate-dependent enzyme [Planctomycetes bacterium]|nr:aminotransferase class I/II-fold pyridoxal phosphate-dependent enzyme [Planctomycetota bacterium]
MMIRKNPPDGKVDIDTARIISPRRHTSEAVSIEGLAEEQLKHFCIDKDSPYGQAMFDTVVRLYEAQLSITELWEITSRTIRTLDRTDRIAYFNAKKFLCFQLAKLLDNLQNPFRATYQSLELTDASLCAKGAYSIFDNVSAIFSANPVIVRSATYIYACTEWIDDAFKGKELLHQVYTRLLNPTSIALANYIVDIEAGPSANQYWAYNFNSGMAAIDAILTHLINFEDIIISSRNTYGGTYQLLVDLFAKKNKQKVTLEWFDGYTGKEFAALLEQVKYKNRLAIERNCNILIYLESPCNPHGYVLDVPEICKIAHQGGCRVVLDSTIGTPFLNKPLMRDDPQERPDYVLHSYTKDLCGHGTATAGVVIGRNDDMFMPKGTPGDGTGWEETLFWDVYYIKGAFLDADKAFDVLSGIKTLDLRMKKKCITTKMLATFLDSHPDIRVNCNALKNNSNYAIAQKVLRYGMSAPLFTIDMDSAGLSREVFQRFFDCLAPMYNHMVSLGQMNTVVLCPALTSHSEMTEEAQREAGIYLTTIRISVGAENPKQLMAYFVNAARLTIEPSYPGFTDKFMPAAEVDRMIEDLDLEGHRSYIKNYKPFASYM